MFFVSEEFLRKYEAGEAFDQTIDVAIPLGHELFEDTEGKKGYNRQQREESSE
jgi:hypothetical protein